MNRFVATICGLLIMLMPVTVYAIYGYEVPMTIEDCMREGRFEEARTQLNEYRRSNPDNPLAIFYLAELEDDHNTALALYREAERLAKGDLASWAVYERGELLLAGGYLAAAEDEYNHVLTDYQKSGAYVHALYRLGVITLLMERYEEARVHFDLCLERNPDEDLRIHAVAGKLEYYVSVGDWQGVLDNARTVLEMKDNYNELTPRVLEVIAQAWRELGDDEKASEYLRRLLNDFPDSYQAHSLRTENTRYAESLMSSNSDEDKDSNRKTDEDTPPVKPVEIEAHEKRGDLSVQAAAFQDKDYALKFYRNLKEGGFDVRLDMKTVGETHFYVVQVGYFDNREDADVMARRVTEFTDIKATVVTVR